MKKARTFFALLGTVLFLIVQSSCKDDPPPVKNLTTETARLNGRCPEMVDPETQLDSIVLTTEGKLAYCYTMVNRKAESVYPQAFKAFLIPAILENVRYNRDLRMFRDSSVTLLFNYVDRDGEFVTEITIRPEQYQ